MVANDAFSRGIFIALGILLLVLVLGTISLFDTADFLKSFTALTPEEVSPAQQQQLAQEIPDLGFIAYPVVHITTEAGVLFEPGEGEIHGLSQVVRPTVCAHNGFDTPSNLAGCLYRTGLASDPVDFFN